jgi:hypothetical protein
MLDASIYNQLGRGVKSVQDYAAEDQARQLGAAQLQAAQVNNLLGQQKSDEYTQTVAERNALRDFMRSGNADLSSPQGQNQLMAVAPTLAPSILKQYADTRKSNADVGKTNAEAGKVDFETALARQHAIANLAGSATDQTSWGRALAVASHLGADVSQVPQQFDPNTAKQIADMAMTQMQRLEQAHQAQVATETGRHNKAEETISVQNNAASNETSRANNAATIVKDYRVAGLDAKGNDTTGQGGLSPAAIENAAHRYNLDGTLPPQIGRGTQGARDLRAIQNRSAELALAAGTDPTQLRVNQMDAKSAGTALSQLTRAKTMAASFEQTANANASLALDLSKKLDRTGVPLLNAGIQYLRTNAGSPEAAQWAAANETFVNEYAKIMSGGMGSGPVTDSARNKAHALLTTDMTPQQYEGNVKLLQREMQNRMKGFEDQETALHNRLRGQPSAPTTAATAGVPDDIAAILTNYGGKK